MLMLGLTAYLGAQEPDFRMDSLSLVRGQELRSSPEDASAAVSLYSNGEFLSLIVEVKDDAVENEASNYFTDHVEVLFSLPPQAYPENFDYQRHPYYLYSRPRSSRSQRDKSTPRLFSAQDDQLKDEMEVQTFLSQHNYPKPQAIRKDSLDIPFPPQLVRERVDYGLVHFGLFPDNRAPVLYNARHHLLLEKSLDIKMGAVESGIIYTVDQQDDGYILTAQIYPEALGFVFLPNMPVLNLSVDVVDTDSRQHVGLTVLSTSGDGRHSMKARTFNEVKLQKPLDTNFSSAPDRVYEQTGYRPSFTYTQEGWVSTGVDVDALHYANLESNGSMSEVRFLQRPQQYQNEAFPDLYLNLEQFTITYDYVKAMSRKVSYTLLNGQVFRSQYMRPDSLSYLPRQHFFTFPDGQPGLLLTENTTLNPYGWGDCGQCIQEQIRLYRVTRDASEEILHIEQGESEPAYCYIGPLTYPGYFVSQVNWVKEGELMVLQLLSRQGDKRKRIRVSWQPDGSGLEMQELP
jgi:hypothetical protein